MAFKLVDIWRPSLPQSGVEPWLRRSLDHLHRVLRLIHLRVELATTAPSECRRYLTTDFAVSNDDALATVPGLSFDVAPGTYLFRAHLTYDCDVAGGTKYAIGGTATASAALWYSRNMDDATGAYVEVTRHTAVPDSRQDNTTTAGTVVMEGLVVVSAAGTVTVEFAQRSGDPAASTVLALSWFELYEAANPL